jgi:hypothetical protein
MLENVKKFTVQGVVLLINIALVSGGVSYFQNQQAKKDAAKELASNVSEEVATEESIPSVDPVAEKAAQLQKIIETSAAQKTEAVAKNTGTVTVQQPKTVTKVIPGATKTVTTTSPSSSSSKSTTTTTKAAPAKKTKTS